MASLQCEDARHADLPQKQKSELVLNYWPAGDHDRGASTSGINCLIVLLKRIYAALLDPPMLNSKRSQIEDLKKMMEADNPFMAHAWLVFGPSSDGVGAALIRLTDGVWGKELKEIAHKDLHFENLVAHARMNTTLWSMPRFNLMLEHLWWQQDTRQWRQLQHETTPTEVKDYFAKWNPTPTPGSLCLGAFPGMSLDVEVNKLFGEFSVGNFTVLVRPDAPVFFYATFTVKDVGEEKLDFNAFRRFTLETGQLINVDGVMRWQRTGRAGQMPYNLMAIVKYRDTADGSDSIRIYDDFGSNSIPIGKLPDYASPDWKMADMKNGDTFLAMFVYSRMPPKTRPPFPEVFMKRNLDGYLANYQVFSSLINGGQEEKRDRDAGNRQ
ncbi:hypothetical protein MANI_017545 [Metarhizium anisopliae]